MAAGAQAPLHRRCRSCEPKTDKTERQLPRQPRGDAMERQAELTEIEGVLASRGAEDCAYAAPTANRSFRTPREAARISRLRVKPPRTAGWRVILRARRGRAGGAIAHARDPAACRASATMDFGLRTLYGQFRDRFGPSLRAFLATIDLFWCGRGDLNSHVLSDNRF